MRGNIRGYHRISGVPTICPANWLCCARAQLLIVHPNRIYPATASLAMPQQDTKAELEGQILQLETLDKPHQPVALALFFLSISQQSLSQLASICFDSIRSFGVIWAHHGHQDREDLWNFRRRFPPAFLSPQVTHPPLDKMAAKAELEPLISWTFWSSLWTLWLLPPFWGSPQVTTLPSARSAAKARSVA